jgi:hypothetical protein
MYRNEERIGARVPTAVFNCKYKEEFINLMKIMKKCIVLQIQAWNKQ